MILRILLFLVLNFGALAIGGFFTSKGVTSDWYFSLNKAPWSPPGWLFGVAWTTIMICFSIYMAYLWPTVQNKKLLIALYALQWILNIAWNPTFFYFQNTGVALVLITTLTLLVGYFLIGYWIEIKIKTALLLPYFIWLLIATSLNGYIYLRN